ncbi:MAG TPA: carbohydrate binding domain-containing protein, partial [Candidatus Acidoferrum sp.]|nr:carbohydrate binding domain-containing protein [Candidatus Acidoferrum sp.]
ESQKAYARALLDRVNPYTKTSYTSEPSVAFVEINNEAGLVHAWLGGHVDTFPEVFLRELGEQWNAWLKQRHGTTAKLRLSWSAGEQALGVELLNNGDFSQQTKGWQLEQHSGAQAKATVAGSDVLVAPRDGNDAQNGALRKVATSAVEVHVNKPGSETWHVQFGQAGLKFETGQAHTVSFRAKSESPYAISVSVAQAHAPWSNLGLAAEAPLTNVWREFRFVFNAAQSDTNARVTFGRFGGEGATISLANVSVKPGGVEGLRAGEELGAVPLFQKKTFGQRTPEAQRDFMRFLTDTEERYWVAMYRFLKDELNVKALVGGTIGGCSPLNVQAKMDWADTHAYWQHPHFPRKQWDMNDWIVNNKSMVNERGGTLPGLAMKRIHGKPHAVTEYNHAAPNTFSSEGFLLLAAYGAMQDWDAIYAYSYAHTRISTGAWNSRKITSFFDIDQHPTKMATLVSAAAMFLRGDVKASETGFKTKLLREAEVDFLRTASAWSLVDGSKEIPKEAALLMKIAVVVDPLVNTGKGTWNNLRATRFIADNGQLIWDISDPRRGVVTINSDATRGVIGYGGGKKFALRDITIEPGATMQDGWSTITVNSFGKSFLITATGLTENTGMGWKNAEKNSVGRDWGTDPSLVEGVLAKITFTNVPLRTPVTAYVLDERGARRKALPVRRLNGNGISINIGPQWKTLWYEVEVQ